MKRLIIIIYILAILPAFAAVSYAVFSGFSASQNSQISGGEGLTVYEVYSESDLVKAARYNVSNSGERATQTEERLRIKLLASISLTKNLLITSDCNLYLNDRTINLNGHTMTFRHNFEGEFLIDGGTVIDMSSSQSGKVIIDTPFAFVTASGLTGGELLEIKSYSSLYLSEKIYSLVERDILSGPAGKYYYNDIPLPIYYSVYEIDFVYSSSNVNAIDNSGKVLDKNIAVDVTLTLNLSFDEETTYSRAFVVSLLPLNAVDPITEKLKWLILSEKIFENSVLHFLDNDKYVISESLKLIGKHEYSGIVFSYAVANET